MDRLSSCYFCGAALDASLSEYPVVPKTLRASSEPNQTVVLCPTCRRKLSTIVEAVVAADETTPELDDDYSADIDESGVDPQPASMERNDATESDDETVSADFDWGTDETSSESRSNGQTPLSNADETVDAASGHDGTDADEDRDIADRDAPDTTEEHETTADTTDGNDDDPSLTRLEYNKVMRLLQNRDLPVNRLEIREVATSAYGIEPEEFDAVIEAAIDRGLIAEQNGQFVAPE